MNGRFVYGDSSVIPKTTEKPGGNVHTQTHASRYHGTGSWPPAFEAILRGIDKIDTKRGYFTSPKEFRGVCTNADKSYTRGGADDCMRLMKETGVLVSAKVDGKTRLLINPRARQNLASAFEQGLTPEFPSQDKLEKSASSLLESLRKRSTKSGTKTQPSIAPVAMPPQATSPAVAAPPEPQTASPQTQETTPMPAVSPAPALPDWTAKPVPVPRFVAYLPPGAAREVWLFLSVCVTRLKEFGARIAVPNGQLPDGVECSTAEFDEWLETFARAGVIECLGESGGDNDAFRFLIHPDEIHTVEIERKLEVRVSEAWIRIMDQARREIDVADRTPDRLRRCVRAFVETHFPDVHTGTAGKKLIGYREQPSRTSFNWGTFYLPAHSDRYLPCLPGLEPYTFVPVYEAPERRTRHKPIKTPLKTAVAPQPEPTVEPEPVIAPAQVREPEPVPALEPVSAPIAFTLSTENLLERISEECRRLEEAKRLLMALKVRERKRAELAAELESLDASIAADHARLDALKIEF